MSCSWRVQVEATSFIASQFPPENVPEIAVAGRSNVGKSTLINALLNTRLAHVGGTPGKTRSVNFYSVECSMGSRSKELSCSSSETPRFRLVDLPGYGYAERSRSERKIWSQLTASYVENRKSLILVCHLVDFRHGLLTNDNLLQHWLDERGKPVMVIFTKADKISKGKRRATLQEYVRDGLKSVDVPIITSDVERCGIDETRKFLETLVLSETVKNPGMDSP
jgi:GTP-binding protein